MRTILVIFLWLFVVEFPLIIRGACPSGPIKLTITDTNIGQEISRTEVDGTAKIDSFTVKLSNGVLNETIGQSYFKPEISSGILTLSTTEAIKNLGRDADTNGDTKIGFSVNVNIHDCTSVLTFLVVIQNTYANEPIFSVSSYKYSLPMPIMPKSDFTVYGQKIAVSDINFANTGMTMTINSEDFDVSGKKIDNKHFEAVFSAKKYIRFTESQTYTLTAMNSGSKQAQVNIVIDVDTANGLDEPSFDKSYYFFEYSTHETRSLKPKDGDIVVKSNKPNNAVYELTGDFKDNFLTSFDNTSSHFSLTLNPEKPLPSDVSGQIVLTLSFTTDAIGYTAIIVDVITANIIPSFSSDHYTGKYDIITNQIEWLPKVDIKDATDVKLSDGVSKLLKIDNKSYSILPITSLEKTNFYENLNLVFTVTATSSTKTESQALFVLSFATKELKFDKSYYSGTYSDNNGKPVVTLDNGNDIGFSDVKDFTGIKIQFGSDYKNNFEIKLENSKWTISVSEPLSESILNENTKLMIPLTATWSAYEVTASSVLILNLPEKPEVKFDKPYYTGSYVKGGDKDNVELNGQIHLTGAKADDITIKIEGYEDNFNGSCDTITLECIITVHENLNLTTLSASEELIVTIVANTAVQPIPAKTLLVLKLPMKKSTFAFSKQYYHAVYSIQKSDGEKATVDLEGLLSLIGADSDDVSIDLDAYSEYFQLSLDSTSWILNVKKSLEPEILKNNTELVASLTATKQNKSNPDYAKATLIIKLPDKTTITFSRTQYYGEYLVDENGSAEILLDSDSNIETTDIINTNIELNSFTEIFYITMNSGQWSVGLRNSLNSSILSLYTELRLQMTLTKMGVSYGDAGLTIRLPPLIFSKDTYSGSYSIIDGNGGGSVDVEDISLGDVDASYIEFKLTNYIEYFKLTQKSTSWNVEVADKLPEAILNMKSELILTLTASKRNGTGSDHAKATVLIKLPDDTSVAFTKPQYYGEYMLKDNTPVVVLDEDSEIAITDFVNSKITLDSLATNFKFLLDNQSKKWTVNVEGPLNSSILSEYSELKLTLTITKLGINYGEAGLFIRLPPLKFSEDKYTALYSFVDSGVGSTIVDKIAIDNVDVSYIQLKLMDYTDNFYTELSDGKWMIKVKKPMLPDITKRELVTNLQAIRNSDNKILATSVLVISLPIGNATDAPLFSAVTFNGNYINSDTPIVKMEKLISLVEVNSATSPTVYINASNEFSTNFSLVQEKNNQYRVKVEGRLSPEVLDEETNIALTLVATSTEGNNGYATLVVSLPKAVRDTSVQVKNHEILFTGTYKNGLFTSPKIPLVTNNTNEEDISAKMTNDLGIDGKYFSYKYSNGILMVSVDDIPDDVLKTTSVIPLKLAITDRNTQDTIYAVLNVEISSDNSDNGSSSGPNRIGLIVAVSILAALLVMLILFVSFFWFFRLRANKYVEMKEEEETGTKPHHFTKNPAKTSTPSIPTPRRPTGISVGLTDTLTEESSSDQDVPVSTDADPPIYPEKNVAFNEVVEKIDENGGEDEQIEAPDGLLKVADRRPTQFVFAYPLEGGVLDNPDESEESSDHQVSELPENTREKKKSVVFNEYIERRQIEPLEDNEDGNEVAESEPESSTERDEKSIPEL